ncbi:MAG TPA: ATP-binding protein [Gaiellaceae bacterium]|nr:ATP-binding protein [Gaiellaceae bacterium]
MTSDAAAEVLAVLVHEVRSPVAALFAIEEAFAEARFDDDARHELERLAVAACRGIERIVLDASVASLRLDRIEVEDLVRQAATAAALEGARVESRIADDLPSIEGDPQRLRQALDNLVSNAVTHAGADGAVIVRADSSETAVLLSVADSGAGIPLAEQDRIFEKGVRLNEAAAGSGLGLAIARAIVEAHRGTLTVRSTPGRGSTFTIAIPRA